MWLSGTMRDHRVHKLAQDLSNRYLLEDAWCSESHRPE